MADMWVPWVRETANAPGNAVDVNLIPGSGPFTTFATGGFTSGALIAYMMQNADGAEWGHGTYTAGSPNKISRTTVRRTTLGNTSRFNFLGTTEVYTWPIDVLYARPDGWADMFGTDLRNLGGIDGGGTGNRNRIINPRFDVWQAGNSLTPLGAEVDLCDGWHLSQDGAGATIGAYQGDALTYASDTVLNAGGRRYLSLQATVAGSGGTYRQLKTAVEGVHTLASKTVAVGALARADTTRSITVALAQNFGTGGSPSSPVNTSVGTWNLTNSWQWVQGSAALPSISGKTLGSNFDDRLLLYFGLPLNTTFIVELAEVHLREGTAIAAGMAEYRTYAEALQRCQRYRCPLPRGLSGAAYSATQVALVGRTPVPMRANPTIDWSGTGTINLPGIGSFNSSTPPTINFYDVDTGALGILWGGFLGLTVGAPAFYAGAPTKALLNASTF